MTSPLLTTTYSLLAAAGVIALARALHPATFGPGIASVMLASALTVAILHFWKHD